jgi:hypothetical protein
VRESEMNSEFFLAWRDPFLGFSFLPSPFSLLLSPLFVGI